MGYANTKQTVRVNVDEDDKRELEEPQGRNETLRLDSNEKNTIFINESGLYSLIMRSKKPEANLFRSGSKGVLGYANTKQTIRVNVDDDDRNKIEELTKHLPGRCLPGNAKKTVFINESGLCSLIMRSEKPEATLLDSGLRGSWAMPTRSNKFG